MGETSDPRVTAPRESTDEIRGDIARTQRQMSETIDEIQYRLSPDHLKQQARESVRRAGVRTSRGAIERVKANPLGAAMVGMGLWLLMRSEEPEYDYGVEFESDFDDDNFGFESGRAQHLKDRMGEVAENAAHARDRVADAASLAAERARQLSNRTQYRARALGNRTRYRARRAGMQSRDMMMDNPIIGAIAALAVGAIAGSLIPETEREHRMFGETRDRVAGRAGELAHEGIDKAKDVAKSVANAATSTAKNELKSAANEIRS